MWASYGRLSISCAPRAYRIFARSVRSQLLYLTINWNKGQQHHPNTYISLQILNDTLTAWCTSCLQPYTGQVNPKTCSTRTGQPMYGCIWQGDLRLWCGGNLSVLSFAYRRGVFIVTCMLYPNSCLFTISVIAHVYTWKLHWDLLSVWVHTHSHRKCRCRVTATSCISRIFACGSRGRLWV